MPQFNRFTSLPVLASTFLAGITATGLVGGCAAGPDLDEAYGLDPTSCEAVVGTGQVHIEVEPRYANGIGRDLDELGRLTTRENYSLDVLACADLSDLAGSGTISVELRDHGSATFRTIEYRFDADSSDYAYFVTDSVDHIGGNDALRTHEIRVSIVQDDIEQRGALFAGIEPPDYDYDLCSPSTPFDLHVYQTYSETGSTLHSQGCYRGPQGAYRELILRAWNWGEDEPVTLWTQPIVRAQPPESIWAEANAHQIIPAAVAQPIERLELLARNASGQLETVKTFHTCRYSTQDLASNNRCLPNAHPCFAAEYPDALEVECKIGEAASLGCDGPGLCTRDL